MITTTIFNDRRPRLWSMPSRILPDRLPSSLRISSGVPPLVIFLHVPTIIYLHITAEGGGPLFVGSSVTSTVLLCFCGCALVSPLRVPPSRAVVSLFRLLLRWVCKSLARSLNSSIKYQPYWPFHALAPVLYRRLV